MSETPTRDGIEPVRQAPEKQAAIHYPATQRMLKNFRWAHLPERLQAVSRPFSDIAHQMARMLPMDPDTSAMLRKLREAKDCAVTAFLEIKEEETAP